MIYMDKKGHMISDNSPSELHEFAENIGLGREWFHYESQKGRGLHYPHYEVPNAWMRYKAVKYGASPVSTRGLVTILRRRYKKRAGTGKLGFQM